MEEKSSYQFNEKAINLTSKIVNIWTDIIIENDGHFTEMTYSFFIVGC
jgi:hypothetical protein